MAGAPKLLYVVVVDEKEDGEQGGGGSFRYTRPVLQSTLQFMGCKARHAFKISLRVYEVIRSKFSAENSNADKSSIASSDGWQMHPKENDRKGTDSFHLVRTQSAQANMESNRLIQFELYKSQTTTIVTRETFMDIVCDALSEYNYFGPNRMDDLILACRIRERKESVIILLCGTSGCGKSTLSALLGSRLGITTVVSTDSIRHMMRSFVDEKQNPLLWASTYHAGECLDPVAVAQAKAKRKAKKLAGNSGSLLKEEFSNKASNIHHGIQPSYTVKVTELVGKKQMAIEGYKAQSEMVIDSLDRLISAWEDRKESVVVEGVHLSLNFVMGLMKKHRSIIPFVVYIANEGKHMERFAVRAKYMTLDPAKNKYVKYMRNIRAIQEYLCNRADKHLVPKINNTNVDKSVATIHATVFSCLRRREAGEDLYDLTTNTVPVINEEYRKQCAANSMSSKGMFQLIQRQGSSRHLMALLNTDGSVPNAWPIESHNDKEVPISGDVKAKFPDGPSEFVKVEPVNLQFGNFGISALPSDTGGASHNGSIDESRAECTDIGSRYLSSRCSSPRMSEGPAKEVKGEISVSGSEEEADEPADEESNDDQSETDKDINEEFEGSVDEGSTKSDEEFDDLAMQDGLYNGYYSDDEEEPNRLNNLKSDRKPTRLTPSSCIGDRPTKDYQENLYLFSKINGNISHHPFLAEGDWRGCSPKPKKHLNRSHTISALGKSGS